MKNKTFRTAALHMATVLTLAGLNTGSVSAMGFFDAEQQESLSANTSLPTSSLPTTAASNETFKTTEPVTTELPDKITRVFGRTDNTTDKKYYSFTAVRGQKVMIYNMPTKSQGPDWDVEYKIDGEWIHIPAGHSFISSYLTPNQKVLMRVSRSAGRPVVPDDYYAIEFGSAPYVNHGRTELSGDYQWYQPYFSGHLFAHNLSWRSTITDSTGHPLAGAVVNLVINRDETKPYKLFTKEYVTGPSGIINGSVRFDECIGTHRTPLVPAFDHPNTKMRVKYTAGHWSLSVRGNDAVGITDSTLTQYCSVDYFK